MNCPACNSTALQLRGQRNALYPAGIMAIVGLPFALLHQASSASEYHCNGCGTDFTRRTTIAKVARILMILLVVGIILLFTTVAIVMIVGSRS